MLIKKSLITIGLALALSACDDDTVSGFSDAELAEAVAAAEAASAADIAAAEAAVIAAQEALVAAENAETAAINEAAAAAKEAADAADAAEAAAAAELAAAELAAAEAAAAAADELAAAKAEVAAAEAAAAVAAAELAAAQAELDAMKAAALAARLLECSDELDFSGAIASSWDGVKVPSQAIDDDESTTWAAKAQLVDDVRVGETITFKIDDIASITQLSLMWDKSDIRGVNYMVETAKINSDMDADWTVVAETTMSVANATDEAEVITLTETDAEYVRITGYGYSYFDGSKDDGWNTIKEAKVFGCDAPDDVDSLATNTPSTLGGELTGTINNEQATATGTVAIYDLDEDGFNTDALPAGTYGSLAITGEGVWTYTLDTMNADVIALEADSAALVDTFTITTEDSVTTDITISITDAPPAGNNQVAQIIDGSTSKAGVLRYKTGDSATMTTATIKASVRNQSDGEIQLQLYGSSTSSSDSLLDLRMKDDGSFSIDDVTTTLSSVTAGSWIDLEVTVDASADAAPTITISVNGSDNTQTFASVSPIDVTADLLQTVNFKLGSNGGTVTGNSEVDNLEIYSDLTGTTLVFEDDFEGYSVDFDLGTGTDTPYNGSTNQALVKSVSE